MPWRCIGAAVRRLEGLAYWASLEANRNATLLCQAKGKGAREAAEGSVLHIHRILKKFIWFIWFCIFILFYYIFLVRGGAVYRVTKDADLWCRAAASIPATKPHILCTSTEFQLSPWNLLHLLSRCSCMKKVRHSMNFKRRKKTPTPLQTTSTMTSKRKQREKVKDIYKYTKKIAKHRWYKFSRTLVCKH